MKTRKMLKRASLFVGAFLAVVTIYVAIINPSDIGVVAKIGLLDLGVIALSRWG